MIFARVNFQVSSCRESPWVHCNFFTKPKIKYTVKRPRMLPDGYPMRPKTLGERIKKKRLDLDLCQKDVAKIIGVDVNTITLWEKGRHEPGKRFLKKIVSFLEIKQ